MIDGITHIAEMQGDIELLKQMVVMRFDHDTPPSFEQGYRDHEVLEPVTAEHCRWFVAEIESLRRQLEESKEREKNLVSAAEELIAKASEMTLDRCQAMLRYQGKYNLDLISALPKVTLEDIQK